MIDHENAENKPQKNPMSRFSQGLLSLKILLSTDKKNQLKRQYEGSHYTCLLLLSSGRPTMCKATFFCTAFKTLNVHNRKRRLPHCMYLPVSEHVLKLFSFQNVTYVLHIEEGRRRGEIDFFPCVQLGAKAAYGFSFKTPLHCTPLYVWLFFLSLCL